MVHQHDPQANGQPRILTADEFVAELRQLRPQVGNPSFRRLSRIAEQRIAASPDTSRPDPLPPSTTSEVLSGKRLPRLPRLEFVESYVAACLHAGPLDEAAVDAEVARWRDLWRAAATREPLDAPAAPADPPPRRRGSVLLLTTAVFLAGLGAGAAGTWWWVNRPVAESPDVCLPPGTADPVGEDVLKLPGAGQLTGSWWVNRADIAALRTDGRRFEADVAKGTASPGAVVIVKGDVTLVKDRTYAVAFTVTADRDTTVRARVQHDEAPDYQASHDRQLSVSTTPCRHLYRFVAVRTSDTSEMTFQVGGHAEDFRLTVEDVVLVAEPG